MTVEEGLIALLAGVASVLLFLGLAQALDSRPDRRARPGGLGGPPASVPEAIGSGDAGAGARRALGRVNAPGSGASPPSPRVQPFRPASGSTPPPGEAAPRAAAALEAGPGDHVPAAGRDDPDLVDACVTLCLSGKHAELLAEVAPRLDSPGGDCSTTVTALRTLAALAHRALGDEVRARAAFGSAVSALERWAVEDCPKRAARMSLQVARRLLDLAAQAPEGAEDRITGRRLAAFWLRWHLVAVPGDLETPALLDSVEGGLAEQYAGMVLASMERRDWPEGCRFIQEAANLEELPPARREALMETLGVRVRRRIDRLTAPAIRGSRDERRAESGVAVADLFLEATSGTSFPLRHRAAVSRRVWRGYAMLGARRLRSGRADEAAEVLFRALGMKEISRRRQRQVRNALAAALEAMSERTAAAVSRLIAAGERPAAAAQVEALMSRIRQARDAGVSEEALTGAFGRAGLLARQLGTPAEP